MTSEVEQDPAAELVQLIARHATTNGIQDTAVPDLHLFRSFTASEPIHTVVPAVVVPRRPGQQDLTLGTDVLSYGPAEFLLVSVNMPVAAQLLEASAEKPHLALHVDLDLVSSRP